MSLADQNLAVAVENLRLMENLNTQFQVLNARLKKENDENEKFLDAIEKRLGMRKAG